MKNRIQIILTMLFFGIIFQNAKAQVTQALNKVSNKEWQFSARAGFDKPLFDEDFKYIDYKGGFMGGVSINHYWNWFGLQTDFDYMKNSPIGTGLDNLDYAVSGSPMVPTIVSSYTDVATQKKDITRMFAGFGPAFRYLNESRKFQAELSVLAGIGFIDGGEILIDAKRVDATRDVLAYHSGFDNLKLATGKAQARFTYFFNTNWGLHAGAYYMKHFGGAEESSQNELLKASIYGSGLVNPVYFAEPIIRNIKGEKAGVSGGYDVVLDQLNIRSFVPNEPDMKRKIDLASAGVFAGITYRFAPKMAKTVVEKPILKAEKYCIQITAKDKYTNEIIPNTDVALKNNAGEIIKTAKTDAFGVIKFCDVMPADYKIDGVFNEIALQGNSASTAEFVNGKTVIKDILYTDRNFIVKGKAVECNSATSIAGITVILENNEKAFKKSTVTDDNGVFLMHIPEVGIYTLYGKKDNYFSQTEEINASNYNRDKTLFVKLEMCAEKADCGKGIGLKNILFDLAKYNINDAAKVELNRLVRFMKDNSGVKVELGSHTDSRASAAYNQTLSQNRANASVNYIVSQGIERSRITGKGYGETKLLNKCADGVSCSEEQHAINRRTEMKVICPQ